MLNTRDSINKCFVATTTQKVLAFLSLHSDQKLHEREISRRVKISLGAANKAVKTLWKLGMISREEIGKMCFYSIIRSPLIEEFKLLNAILLLQPLLEELKPFSNKIILSEISVNALCLFILCDDQWKITPIIEKHKETLLSIKIQLIIKTSEQFIKEENVSVFKQLEKGRILWDAIKPAEEIKVLNFSDYSNKTNNIDQL